MPGSQVRGPFALGSSRRAKADLSQLNVDDHTAIARNPLKLKLNHLDMLFDRWKQIRAIPAECNPRKPGEAFLLKALPVEVLVTRNQNAPGLKRCHAHQLVW